mgnify:CR=1 FL=1
MEPRKNPLSFKLNVQEFWMQLVNLPQWKQWRKVKRRFKLITNKFLFFVVLVIFFFLNQVKILEFLLFFFFSFIYYLIDSSYLISSNHLNIDEYIILTTVIISLTINQPLIDKFLCKKKNFDWFITELIQSQTFGFRYQRVVQINLCWNRKEREFYFILLFELRLRIQINLWFWTLSWCCCCPFSSCCSLLGTVLGLTLILLLFLLIQILTQILIQILILRFKLVSICLNSLLIFELE